jgi:hypothetical protein
MIDNNYYEQVSFLNLFTKAGSKIEPSESKMEFHILRIILGEEVVVYLKKGLLLRRIFL